MPDGPDFLAGKFTLDAGDTITESEVTLAGVKATDVVQICAAEATAAALAALHVAPGTDKLTLTYTEASPAGTEAFYFFILKPV
jgi:hypothetical protein